MEYLPFLIDIQQQTMSDNHKQVGATPIRQRLTPTFYHHNIFNYQQENKSLVRITPTFESTVFNIDGYQIQTNHSRTLKKKQETKEVQPCVYKNQSRERKQAFLYPFQQYGYGQTCKTSRNKDQKEKLTRDINQLGGRTSRLRKCVQMMSNPIFGGCTWTPFVQNTQENQKTYNPKNYQYQRQIHKQQVNQKIPISQYQNQDKNIKTKQVIPQKRDILKEQPKPKKQSTKSINKTNEKHKNILKRFKSAANIPQKHSK